MQFFVLIGFDTTETQDYERVMTLKEWGCLLSKKAEAKAMWENVLKPKWDEIARDRGAKLLAELKGTQPPPSGTSPARLRG